MTFLKICLKSFHIFSSVLKKFLHNQTKYDINWKIKKKNLKKLFLCHEIAWIQIRIRIRIRILQKGLDPDPNIQIRNTGFGKVVGLNLSYILQPRLYLYIDISRIFQLSSGGFIWKDNDWMYIEQVRHKLEFSLYF